MDRPSIDTPAPVANQTPIKSQKLMLDPFIYYTDTVPDRLFRVSVDLGGVTVPDNQGPNVDHGNAPKLESKPRL